MGATFLSDRIYRAIADNTPPGVAVGHGMTYSGHPVSAAIGLEVLRLYEEGGLLANGQEMGAYFGSKLATLASHPLVRSEEHTSELQSLMRISYAVFCLKKKTRRIKQHHTISKKY